MAMVCRPSYSHLDVVGRVDCERLIAAVRLTAGYNVAMYRGIGVMGNIVSR